MNVLAIILHLLLLVSECEELLSSLELSDSEEDSEEEEESSLELAAALAACF